MPNKPSDQRAYVRIAVELPGNPKIAAVDDPVASWAHVVAICYCGEHLTDGIFPVAAILRRACASKAKADKLVREGLWHRPGHDCESCPQPTAGSAVVHDYLKHQHTGSYVRTVSDTRAEAGRKGAAQRWQTDGKRHGKPEGKQVATWVATLMADAWQTTCQEVRSKNKDQNQPPASGVENISPDRARGEDPTCDCAPAIARDGPPPSLPDPTPRPGITGPNSGDAFRFVNRVIGLEHPTTVRTTLAIEATKLLADGIDELLVTAALELWLDKPHLHPRTLPSLVSEVIRGRNRPRPLGTTDRRIAEWEALKDDPDPALLAAAGIPMPTRLKALPGGAA